MNVHSFLQAGLKPVKEKIELALKNKGQAVIDKYIILS